MQYLVSAENTTYHHWQLELLIESFKYNQCENDLLICLAKSNQPINPLFWNNIPKHKNIKGYENIGEIRGYKPLNELYSLMWANQQNWIKQPFAYIPTDVVLNKKLSLELKNQPEVTIALSPFFTFETAEENVGAFWNTINKDKNYFKKSWIPIGPILIFNNIPTHIFERTVILAEKLALQQLLEGKNIWEYTDKLAWAMNLADLKDKIKITGNYHLTTNMLEEKETNFIHYEHGLPPVFNKTMFKYSPISFGDPYEILAENSPTRNAHFISQLAQKRLENRIDIL